MRLAEEEERRKQGEEEEARQKEQMKQRLEDSAKKFDRVWVQYLKAAGLILVVLVVGFVIVLRFFSD